jgi:hypothetical protein
MTIMKTRLAAADKKLADLKEARETAAKERRNAYRLNKADEARKQYARGRR